MDSLILMYKLVRKLVGDGRAAATSLNRRFVGGRVGEVCIDAASSRAAALAGAWVMKEQGGGNAVPIWAAALAGARFAEEQEAGKGEAIAAEGGLAASPMDFAIGDLAEGE